MEEEHVGTVILGAGPAGLACAHELAKGGRKPVVLERGSAPGGLMRSIVRNGYQVDVGRKELYSRLPEVDSLWHELLGEDYREYPHRVGVLWKGHIVERSSAFRGKLRGIPPWVLAAGGVEYGVKQLLSPILPQPKNEEEYWYRIRGRLFSRVLSQGHFEKFQGYRWAELPPPRVEGRFAALKKGINSVLGRALAKDYGTATWRHPSKGTGQIVDRLVESIRAQGGEIRLDTTVERIEVDGDAGGLAVVATDQDGGRVRIAADHVVSSVPLDILARFLGEPPPEDLKARDTRGRGTILVYMFLDGPPQFPHAWLDVTDPDLQVGRVTNYSGFHGEMVPVGKSCIAAEYFLIGDHPLFDSPKDAALALAIAELAPSGLIDPAKMEDHLVIQLPGAFAADDYRSWTSPGVRAFLDRVGDMSQLWNVNRAGTDVATYAGLQAAWGILWDDRAGFEERADPARPLGIDSTRLWS